MSMMSYRRANKLGGVWVGLRVLAIGLVVVVLMMVVGPGLARVVEDPVARLGDTRLFVRDSAEVTLRSKRDLVVERDLLVERITVLEAQLARMTERGQRAQIIQEYVEAALPREVIPAGVVSLEPYLPFGTVILDRGRYSGVRVGQEVLAEGVYALGRVVSVSEQTARVHTFDMPGGETMVRHEASGEVGVLVGRGRGAFYADMPRETEITVGDWFVLPGLRQTPVGEVVAVEFDEQDPTQHVLIQGFATVHDQAVVYVVQDEGAIMLPLELAEPVAPEIDVAEQDEGAGEAGEEDQSEDQALGEDGDLDGDFDVGASEAAEGEGFAGSEEEEGGGVEESS